MSVALINELESRTRSDRREWLRANGSAQTLQSIGSELQSLCFSDLDRASEVSVWLTELAEDGGDTSFLCRMLCLRAFVLSLENHYDEAMGTLDRAGRIAMEAGDARSRAGVAQTAMQPLVRLGRYREAIESAETAIRLYGEAGDEAAVARAHSNLGVVHRMLDHPAAALRHFDQALPALGDDAGAVAQVQSNRAEALLDLVEFTDAEAAFRSASASFEAAGMTRAAAIVEGNLADLLGQQGRVDESMRSFERARTRFESGGAPGDAARIDAELSEVLITLGLLRDACESAEAAVETLLEHGMRREAARAMLALGSARRMLGLGRDAADALTRAAALSAELGWRAGVGRANREAARLAVDCGDLDGADELLADALRDLTAASQDRAIALLLRAEVNRRQGKTVEASRSAEEALGIATAIGSVPLRGRSLHEQARQAEAASETERAITLLREAVECVERQRGVLVGDRARSAWLGEHIEVYQDLCDSALRRKNSQGLELAFRSVEQSKSRSLLELVELGAGMSDQHVAHSDPQAAELIERYHRARGELAAVYTWDRFDTESGPAQGVREARQRRAAELERTLTRIEGRLSSLRSVGAVFCEPLALAEAQRLVPDNGAIIEYFVCGDTVGAFVIRRDGGTAVRTLCSLGELTRRVEAARFQIDRGVAAEHSGARGSRLLQGAVRASGSVYDLALRPIASGLEDAGSLVFVPAGPLHGFPFGAMHDGDRWLVERASCSVVPSVSVLGVLSRNSGGSPSGAAVRIAAIEDRIAPEILDEAEDLAALYGGRAELLRGSDATGERVFRDLRPGQVLHLACHGDLGGSEALSARIRLADRWFTARELISLDLNGARVILSCCDVGRSRITTGDEIFGMLRAALAGGACGVVAGFWPAHDTNTRTLMLGLHRELASSPEIPMASALTTAQRRLLRQHPHPSNWATFSAIGI